MTAGVARSISSHRLASCISICAAESRISSVSSIATTNIDRLVANRFSTVAKFSTVANTNTTANENKYINGDTNNKQSTGTKETLHEVKVTQSRTSDDGYSASTPYINNDNDSKLLVDRLLLRTSKMINSHAANVVAYSGGVDSSLVAALVHRAFSNYDNNDTRHDNEQPTNYKRGSIQAVLGVSPAVPQTQILMARNVAKVIGIPLNEVNTTEGSDETYQKNDGYACYVCKTHLYSTLESVANAVMEEQKQQNVHSDGEGSQQEKQSHPVILYNGTNADDTQDPTRLGLLAASNFQVHSPLDQITKDEVRMAARYLGLPNWNAAASPCLRSRLAKGVMATQDHLHAVEMAEEFVRRVLELNESVNARVRMLSGGKAMVELDNSIIYPDGNNTGKENWAANVLRENRFEEKCIDDWGFKSFGGVRGFKTGSVAAMPSSMPKTKKEDDDINESLASAVL